MFFSYPKTPKLSIFLGIIILKLSLISDHYVDYFCRVVHSITVSSSNTFNPLSKILQPKPPLFVSMRMVLVPQLTNYRCELCHSEEYSFDLASICFSSGWLGALQLKRRNAKDQQMGDISSVDLPRCDEGTAQ